MKKHTNLSSYERDLIGFYLNSGESVRSIAAILERGKSSISEEIIRNSINGKYLPIQADQKAKSRRSLANKNNPRISDDVWEFVVDFLKRNWSPEEISGRLRFVLYPDNPEIWISAECIYSRIYSKEFDSEELWKLLTRKHKRRKSKHRGRKRGSKIPCRVSISQRSQEINNRAEFGHWEGDSIVSKGRKSGLHTEVERKTRLVKIRKISKINSEKSIKAQVEIFTNLPRISRRSTTLDNGTEFVNHQQLHNLGMDTYFAHPYCSWERGTNEWHNGLIRRYYPKGTDFSRVTHEEIRRLEEELNNRPRKILNFKTPREKYEEELKLASVRIGT